MDKGNADIITFELKTFLDEIYRVTKGTIIVFCGQNQLSEIFCYFNDKQKKKQGTVRQLVWHKSNPSPMNGEYIYLSACENAIWFRKSGGVFNAKCKHNVFTYPCGRSKLHPTEKNHDLITDLIQDNSNESQIVFDPCAGSASHCYVAKQLNRRYIGIELDAQYFEIAKNRLAET